MRILVFSDSHTSISSCCSLVEKISGTDMIIHAGDHASDAEKLKIKFPDIDVVYVRGNCDFTAADDELVKDVCGKRIFPVSYTHLDVYKRQLVHPAQHCS